LPQPPATTSDRLRGSMDETARLDVDTMSLVVRALVLAEPTVPGGAQGTLSLLQRLCSAAVRSVPASGAGVTVMTEEGVRGLSVASDAVSERIDELQFDLGEGPCNDAFATRRPVLEADLVAAGGPRWPVYSPAAQDEGVRAVFAFPLQIGAARLGVLDLYRDKPGSLSSVELTQALSFAYVATALLLDGQQAAPLGRAADGLDDALDNRSEVYQAQGMVMVQLRVTLIQALAVLRAYAYSHERALGDVARDVVNRRLRLDADEE
jgi:GAF domain/ANTAR domain